MTSRAGINREPKKKFQKVRPVLGESVSSLTASRMSGIQLMRTSCSVTATSRSRRSPCRQAAYTIGGTIGAQASDPVAYNVSGLSSMPEITQSPREACALYRGRHLHFVELS